VFIECLQFWGPRCLSFLVLFWLTHSESKSASVHAHQSTALGDNLCSRNGHWEAGSLQQEFSLDAKVFVRAARVVRCREDEGAVCFAARPVANDS
jgi:hypothetical protein